MAAVALVAWFGTPAGALAAGVQFTLNGKPGPSLSGQQVYAATDVRSQTIAIYGGEGSGTSDEQNGTKASTVLGLIGLPPSSVVRMEIRRGDGGPRAGSPIVIHGTEGPRNEIADGFDGPDDPRTVYALFNAYYNNGATVAFENRPQRATAPGQPRDANSGDFVSVASGKDLLVDLTTTGRPLGVQVVGPATGSVGGGLSYTAQVEGGLPGDATVSWSFGDGQTASGPSVSHPFAAAGSYAVTATVSSSTGSGVGLFQVQVGAVPGGGTAPTPVPDPGGGSGSGGAGSGGGTAGSGGGAAGPDSVASGPAKGDGDTSDAAPRDPTRTRRATSKGKATATPRPAATPRATQAAAPTSTPAAAPAGDAGGTTPGGGPTTPADTTPATTPSQDDEQGAAPIAKGGSGGNGAMEISGVLANARGRSEPLREALAAADALAQLPEEAAPSRAAAGDGAGVAGWLGGGTIVLGLLGFGAVREGVRAFRLPTAP